MRHAWLALLLVPGCLAPTDPPTSPDTTRPNPFAQTTCEDVPVPERRERGQTSTRASSGRFIAEATETLTQGLGCTTIALLVATPNGGIEVRAGIRYSVVAEYRAWGETADEAASRLEGLSMSHSVHPGRHGNNIEVEGRADSWPERTVRLVLTIPASLQVARLQADGDNGGIHVTGLAVPEIVARMGNGGIDLALDAPWASGLIRADVDNGGIELRLESSASHGYDVRAAADVGGVQVVLADGEVVDSTRDSAHVRTKGYSSRTVQTAVQLNAGTGGVAVRG